MLPVGLPPKHCGTLRGRGLDLKAGCVVFIGGGSLLLREYLEQSGKIGRCIFVKDICANAKGYALPDPEEGQITVWGKRPRL